MGVGLMIDAHTFKPTGNKMINDRYAQRIRLQEIEGARAKVQTYVAFILILLTLIALN